MQKTTVNDRKSLHRVGPFVIAGSAGLLIVFSELWRLSAMANPQLSPDTWPQQYVAQVVVGHVITFLIAFAVLAPSLLQIQKPMARVIALAAAILAPQLFYRWLSNVMYIDCGNQCTTSMPSPGLNDAATFVTSATLLVFFGLAAWYVAKAQQTYRYFNGRRAKYLSLLVAAVVVVALAGAFIVISRAAKAKSAADFNAISAVAEQLPVPKGCRLDERQFRGQNTTYPSLSASFSCKPEAEIESARQTIVTNLTALKYAVTRKDNTITAHKGDSYITYSFSLGAGYNEQNVTYDSIGIYIEKRH